jgi:peptidoglycan/LPS O-acetylase OafA/YrhL
MTAAGPSIVEAPVTAVAAAETPVPPARRPRSARQEHYLPTLDGWRAVAIGLVMWGHALPSVRQLYGPRVAARFSLLWDGGITGVQIFFGISGLLICTRLLDAYHAADGRLSLKTFYIRRAHRILPPAIVTLLVLALLGLFGVITIAPRDLIVTACLGANYARGLSGYVAHFWSLAMEEHFYLLFPPLLALAGVRRTMWIAAILAVAVAAWRQLDGTMGLTIEHLPPVWQRTDGACDGLLWGCVAAILFHRAAAPEWFRRRLTPIVFIAMLGAFVAATIVRPESVGMRLALTTLRALLVAPMLLATLCHPRSLAGRALELRPMRWVGRMSYSLYLWQQLFLAHSGTWTPLLAWAQRWPINLACAFAAAGASYYLIERPFIREGYRATSGQKQGEPR